MWDSLYSERICTHVHTHTHTHTNTQARTHHIERGGEGEGRGGEGREGERRGGEGKGGEGRVDKADKPCTLCIMYIHKGWCHWSGWSGFNLTTLNLLAQALYTCVLIILVCEVRKVPTDNVIIPYTAAESFGYGVVLEATTGRQSQNDQVRRCTYHSLLTSSKMALTAS